MTIVNKINSLDSTASLLSNGAVQQKHQVSHTLSQEVKELSGMVNNALRSIRDHLFEQVPGLRA